MYNSLDELDIIKYACTRISHVESIMKIIYKKIVPLLRFANEITMKS